MLCGIGSTSSLPIGVLKTWVKEKVSIESFEGDLIQLHKSCKTQAYIKANESIILLS